ncbi:MAG: DUF3108 domain-containing protein [Hyphomicrobium sp.]|jgi:hypothetical protein|nr:DUF3108 domain-containing protein [Hyphomicrobium sp.]
MAAWVAWKSVRGPICTALGIAAISSISLASPAHAAEPWPAEVQANYRIQFNGFEVGQFTFNSSVHERTYAISANADISALLGFVRWNGATRVSGALAGNGPRPAGYNFDFRGASKAGSIRMSFGSGAVTTINFNPPMPDPPGTVPVQPAHMRGVLDPLSAVLSLSRPKDGNPCNQRVAVFDGKARFDLAFLPKGEVPIAEGKPAAAPEMLTLCRVRVVPISGHVDDEKAQELKRNLGIEVAFRAVPGADLFVPHRITVPTFAGSAELVAQSLTIRTHREQIALVN